MSMGFARVVMGLPLDPADKHFAKILAVKQAVASSILTATARVRREALKPGEDDGFSKVLDAVRAAEEEIDIFS